MAVFHSFHFDRDSARVQQILNMGALDGQTILNAQDWESVKRQGTAAIEKWIADQMAYKTAVVVLVGAETASRPWVIHEIKKAWDDKRPLLGIRINRLAPLNLTADPEGANPFSKVSLVSGKKLDAYIPLFTPSGVTSKEVYGSIQANIKTWVASGYRQS